MALNPAHWQYRTDKSIRYLYVEARYGGTGPGFVDSIKPAKTSGVLATTGGSATISAVSDQ